MQSMEDSDNSILLKEKVETAREFAEEFIDQLVSTVNAPVAIPQVNSQTNKDHVNELFGFSDVDEGQQLGIFTIDTAGTIFAMRIIMVSYDSNPIVRVNIDFAANKESVASGMMSNVLGEKYGNLWSKYPFLAKCSSTYTYIDQNTKNIDFRHRYKYSLLFAANLNDISEEEH